MSKVRLTPRFKKAGRGASAGGHLLRELPDLTDAQVYATFGEPTTVHAYDDYTLEKGYAPEEWTFRHASKKTPYEFRLYKRDGVYRIGGTAHADAFAKFVERSIRRRARKTSHARTK